MGIYSKFKCIAGGEEFIVNIYGPQLLDEKKELIQNLKCLTLGKEDILSIFIGDFNMIRGTTDCSNCGSSRDDVGVLDNWLKEDNLVDLRLSNALFTWIGSQSKRSRIDRVIINQRIIFVGKWVASATPRKNSNRRGFFFHQEVFVWGPKPLRIFNIWLKDRFLMDLVKEKLEAQD